MAANFLHGAEVIEVQRGARTIRVVKSAVIGLAGIAPNEYGQNVPTLITSAREAANYGDQVPGFTIPQALDAYFKQGPCTVVVVNVFDDTTHTSSVSLEPHAVANRAVKLSYAPIGALSFFQNDGTTAITIVKDVDYTVDSYGNIFFLTNTVANETNIKITYKKLNAAAVTSSVIIGDIDGNDFTGMQCFDLAYSTFGFNVKLIDVPGYSDTDAVSAEMRAKAAKYKAIALCNAPADTTKTDAIAGRGPAGSIEAFNTSSDRVYLLYPKVKAYDPATDDNVNRFLSSYAAGLISKVDNEEGYWVSPSNHEIAGVLGMETYLSAAIDDATCDVNQLNEVGIATVFNGFGTGFRLWGNRSAAWPSVTTPNVFLCVRRTADIIHESLILAMLQFIDRDINQATIDAIRESVNSFMRTLIARGAIVDGKCSYNVDSNDPVEVAVGHLTFDIEFMPPTPAERITFQSFINIAMLAPKK